MRKVASELINLLILTVVLLTVMFVLDEIGRRQIFRAYIYRFPEWTWTLNVSFKVAAIFTLGSAFMRSVRQAGRSLILKTGLGLVLAALLFQAAAISVGQNTPLRTDNLLLAVGLTLLGYALSRERKEKPADIETIPTGKLTTFVQGPATRRLDEMIENTERENNRDGDGGDAEHEP